MTGFADLFFRSSKTPKEASAGYAFRNTLPLCDAQSEVRFFYGKRNFRKLFFYGLFLRR